MPRLLRRPPTDPIALLREARIFSGLSPRVLTDVASGIRWRALLGGEVLFRQGDAGDALYVVVSGRLRAVAADAPAPARVLREIGRGGEVGELALLTDEPRSATIVAVRDATLACLPRAHFQRLLSRHPAAILPLTRALAERLRGNALAHADDAGAAAIALVPLQRDVPIAELSRRLCDTLAEDGSTLHVDADLVHAHLPAGTAHAEVTHPTHGALTAWLDERELAHRFLVYQGDAGAAAWTRRCMRGADRVVLVARAAGDLAEAGRTLRRLSRGPLHGEARVELLLLHDAAASPTDTARWLALRAFAAHHHLRLAEPRDLARVARRLTGRAVGVVLSGGAARGFAHIGVLRALEEAGVPVDQIGGTSMGAVIGAQYAAGRTPDALLELNRLWKAHNPLRDLTLPAIALLGGSSGLAMFEAMFGDRCIEDLWLDYFCVSANLTRSTAVVHRRGLVRLWVRSSVAIPGIVPPLRVENGDLLVDGGVLNNMPADVMRAGGAGRTIAVDVTPPEALPTEDYVDQPSTWQQLCLLGATVLPFTTPRRSPTIFTILYRTMLVASRSLSERLRHEVDVYIAPPVRDCGLFDWTCLDRAAEAGYREARRRLTPRRAAAPSRGPAQSPPAPMPRVAVMKEVG